MVAAAFLSRLQTDTSASLCLSDLYLFFPAEPEAVCVCVSAFLQSRVSASILPVPGS